MDVKERFRSIYRNALVPNVDKEVQQMEDYAKNNKDKWTAAMPTELVRAATKDMSIWEAKALEGMFRDAATQAKINMDNRALAEAQAKKSKDIPELDLSAFEEEPIEVPANDQRSVLSGGNPNWRLDWDVANEAMRKAGFESQDVRKKASKNVSDNVNRRPEIIVPDETKREARKGAERYGKTLNEGDKRNKGERYDDLMDAKAINEMIISNEIGFGDEMIYFMDAMQELLPEQAEAFRKKLWNETIRQDGKKLRVSDGDDDVSLIAQADLRTPSQNNRAEKLKGKFNAGANRGGVEKNEIIPRIGRLANAIGSANTDDEIIEAFKRIYGDRKGIGNMNDIWTDKQLHTKIKTVQGKKEILEKIAHAILIMSLSKTEDTSKEKLV